MRFVGWFSDNRVLAQNCRVTANYHRIFVYIIMFNDRLEFFKSDQLDITLWITLELFFIDLFFLKTRFDHLEIVNSKILF